MLHHSPVENRLQRMASRLLWGIHGWPESAPSSVELGEVLIEASEHRLLTHLLDDDSLLHLRAHHAHACRRLCETSTRGVVAGAWQQLAIRANGAASKRIPRYARLAGAAVPA